MSAADESIHLHLYRHGDVWSLGAARRGEGYSALHPDPDLDADARAESLEADSPGALLELVGQRLDAREAKRMSAAVMGAGLFARTEPTPELEDVARVLEVLEDGAAIPQRAALGLRELSTLAIAQRAGWTSGPGGDGAARAATALEQAERDGAVVHRDAPGMPLARYPVRYWSLRRPDVERQAAGDDPRGEADR